MTILFVIMEIFDSKQLTIRGIVSNIRKNLSVVQRNGKVSVVVA